MVTKARVETRRPGKLGRGHRKKNPCSFTKGRGNELAKNSQNPRVFQKQRRDITEKEGGGQGPIRREREQR